MGSAGGQSGAIEFPAYIEATHSLMLFDELSGNPADTALGNISMLGVMAVALQGGGNPYVAYNYDDINEATLVSEIDTRATSFEATADALDAQADWAAILFDNQSQVDLAGRVERIVRDLGADRDETATLLSRAQNVFEHGLTEEQDWQTFWNTAAARASGLDSADFTALVATSSAAAADAVAAAITAAANAITEPEIAALVDAYRDQVEDQRAVSVRDFASGMADINAVQSSAFLFGLASIYRGADNEVNRFGAQLRFTVYNTALQAFNATGFADIFTRGALSNEQLITQSIAAMVALQQDRTNYERDIIRLFVQAFDSHIRSQLQTKLANSGTRNEFVARGIDQKIQLESFRLNAEQAAAALRIDANRTQFGITVSEHVQNEADLEGLEKRWEFEVFERGANVLAAPGGMAARMPGEKSRVASTVGGALIGAGAGAKIGTAIGAAGGPIGAAGGAAIGTALGGIAGLFG